MQEKEGIAKPPQSNVPEFSVGDLAFALKKTLEDTYGRVRVRGELSRVTVAGSGHLYTTLKDDRAVIDAVCWKGTVSRLSVKPEEGLEVICTGKVTSYPGGSKYQIIIESMELAGEGALLKMLEERRKKLAAEGLFDPARKKELPLLPDVIGVVTSPTGAVIRDILHRLADRFPRHVIVWPVLVQGQGAAAQIADAIRGFQTLDAYGLKRPDLLIVARGGGSLEDLMPFNEEIVVRAIAESRIPVISAIGHETDTTLADYAADLRAPTPTGAAEMAVPRRADLLAQILDDEKRLLNGMRRNLKEYKARLENAALKLGDPTGLLELRRQRLDRVETRMAGLFREYIGLKTQALTAWAARLPHPSGLLRHNAARMERWGDQLSSLKPRLLQNPEKRLGHAAQMLEAYSFQNVLARGFVVVRDNAGTVLTSPDQAQQQAEITLQFKDNKTLHARPVPANGQARLL